MNDASPKIVQLIAHDKNEKLQYEGRCKVIMDTLSKLMLVEPFNEEFKLISALFTWKFVAKKNMLFVFSNIESQDFALIFNDSHRCQKVYDTLLKKGATSGNKEFIYERFLPSLLSEISKNDDSTLKLKEILAEWIERHNGKERGNLIQFLKENNVYDLIFPNGDIRSRKRKLSYDVPTQIGENQSCKKTNSANKRKNKFMIRTRRKRLIGEPQVIEAPNFEILKFFQNKEEKKPWIIVFLDDSHTKCYEYSFGVQFKSYACVGCQQINQHRSPAKLCQKDDGTKYVVIYPESHLCEIRTFNRDKFFDAEKQIVKAPNYEIKKHIFDGMEKSKILIFASSDKSLCYEYTWRITENIFRCCGCSSKNQKVTAQICHFDDGTEYVKLGKSKHVCEPRKYSSTKLYQEIIEKPNFEVKEQKDAEGRNLSKLFIYTSSEKTTCYEFLLESGKKTFLCCGCSNRNKSVKAKILQHDDGTDYVCLSKSEHVCDSRETKALEFDNTEKIIERSNFKILKYKHKGKEFSRLILFDPSNKQLCYEYFWKETQKIFMCSRCPFENRVHAIVCKNAEGKEYLQLENPNHACELREFDLEKYKDDVIIKKPMYEFVQYTFKKTKKIALVIFAGPEKKFCYTMYEDRKKYRCTKCSKLKVRISATVQNQGKDDEFIYACNQKHICEPEKYSTIMISKKMKKL